MKRATSLLTFLFFFSSTNCEDLSGKIFNGKYYSPSGRIKCETPNKRFYLDIQDRILVNDEIVTFKGERRNIQVSIQETRSQFENPIIEEVTPEKTTDENLKVIEENIKSNIFDIHSILKYESENKLHKDIKYRLILANIEVEGMHDSHAFLYSISKENLEMYWVNIWKEMSFPNLKSQLLSVFVNCKKK